MVQEGVLVDFFGILIRNRMLSVGEVGTLWMSESDFVWL